MDKNAIKKYAVWARNELIARVSQKAQQYGITAEGYGDKNADSVNGVLLSATEKKQRQALIAKIDVEGFEQVMEEVAYTWFNRFTALRFMEVNNYLPSHTRIFTNEANGFKPQILTDAISLELEGLDMDKVFELKNANKDEDLYKYLLIVQCNALSSILPGMFQKIADYTELLLPDYLLREGSVIEKLIAEIDENDFNVAVEGGQIEIIGWLYQYYISEKHEEVVDPLHGKIVKKEEIPAATQLFTTDWVVRYIVDNSVGRYWIERNPNSTLGENLDFYVKPKRNDVKAVNDSIQPQDVTFLDPCIGSGHFAIYAFEVLMKIYEEYGYSDREAAAEIVKNNIFGLDIDGRATQLAYFSIMMKARQYDRRFFSRNIQPSIYEIKESNDVAKEEIDYFCGENLSVRKNLECILSCMKDAKEFGSIINVSHIDFTCLHQRMEEVEQEISFFSVDTIRSLVNVAEVLSKKFAIVATNPPYMNKYDTKLKDYINSNYKDYSGDLFSVFIYRNFFLCKENGYSGFMSPFLWMFIKTYEKLRDYIISVKDITTLVQMEYSAYEEATVPICCFVLKNGKSNQCGQYFKLSAFTGGMQVQREKVLQGIADKNCGYYYETKTEDFLKIPGHPLAFWGTENEIRAFSKSKLLSDIANPRQGLITGNVNRFVRKWYECSKDNLNLSARPDEEDRAGKWFPYCNGGAYRKWFGNNDDVVNWYADGYEVKNFVDDKGKQRSRPQNQQYYYHEGGTWSAISSSLFSIRYFPEGHLFSNAGMALYASHDELLYIIGFLNSKLCQTYLGLFNEGLNYNQGDIAKLPILASDRKKEICAIVEELINLSKEDWDSAETSWDFARHPLVKKDCTKIADAYAEWEKECDSRFEKVKSLEEALNRIFIEIYGLDGEVDSVVPDRNITISRANIENDIKGLMSYAVGCIFGRYSLDENGVICAGKDIDIDKYKTFIADADNIVPVLDDAYFEDDIVGLFEKFLIAVYGSENLEENLSFVAKALGGKGMPRDTIRQYFLDSFYSDHVKMYQKCPIYWMFDSGKKNGFKCLIYMHRYHSDTIARIRTDYVHEQQSRYRTALADLEQRINGASTSERVKLNKQLKTIQDQSEELRKYEEKIHHLADQMISIDLDDGVKENYAKFQDVLAKIK